MKVIGRYAGAAVGAGRTAAALVGAFYAGAVVGQRIVACGAVRPARKVVKQSR